MTLQFLRRFTGILLLLVVCATSLWSQQAASVIGVARVLRGNFPEPVLVNLQLHGGTVASTYTDGEGRFGFNNLPGNVYHVIINNERYVPVDITVDVRPDVLALDVLQIMLVTREAKPAQGTPGTSGYVVSPADFTKKYPRKAVNEFQQAVKAEGERKPDEAIRHYQKAIKDAPDFYPAYNNLGSAYLKNGDFASAQKQFQAAMQLNPNDAQSYLNLANVFLLTNRAAESAQLAMQGLQKQPDSAFGNFVLGSALERTGKPREAERALRRALELDPSQTKAHLELVNLYLGSGLKQAAANELKLFLAAAPSDPFAPKAHDVLRRLESELNQAK